MLAVSILLLAEHLCVFPIARVSLCFFSMSVCVACKVGYHALPLREFLQHLLVDLLGAAGRSLG